MPICFNVQLEKVQCAFLKTPARVQREWTCQRSRKTPVVQLFNLLFIYTCWVFNDGERAEVKDFEKIIELFVKRIQHIQIGIQSRAIYA